MYELALLLITIIIADELYHAVLTGYGFTPLEIKRFITPLYIGLGIECI